MKPIGRKMTQPIPLRSFRLSSTQPKDKEGRKKGDLQKAQSAIKTVLMIRCSKHMPNAVQGGALEQKKPDLFQRKTDVTVRRSIRALKIRAAKRKLAVEGRERGVDWVEDGEEEEERNRQTKMHPGVVRKYNLNLSKDRGRTL